MKKLVITVAILLSSISGALADVYTYNSFGSGWSYNRNNGFDIYNGRPEGFQFTSSVSGKLTLVQTGMTNRSGDTTVSLFLYADTGFNAPGAFLGMALGHTMPFSYPNMFPPVLFDFRGYNVQLLSAHKYWLIAYSSSGSQFWGQNVMAMDNLWYDTDHVVFPFGIRGGAFSVSVTPPPV